MEGARDLALQMEADGEGRVLNQFATRLSSCALRDDGSRNSGSIPMVALLTLSVRWERPVPSWVSPDI